MYKNYVITVRSSTLTCASDKKCLLAPAWQALIGLQQLIKFVLALWAIFECYLLASTYNCSYSISLYCITADPPQVTVHPVDQTNIVPGSDVSFNVTATGTTPLSYQWQKDGVDLTDGGSITGATTATLTIAGVMESDEGGYRCVVTNIAGMVTSNTATLTVGK